MRTRRNSRVRHTLAAQPVAMGLGLKLEVVGE
jgi:hypothetical protein